MHHASEIVNTLYTQHIALSFANDTYNPLLFYSTLKQELNMSKLFFKGRIDARQSHVISGYNVNRDVKPGSEEAPISVTVASEARKTEIEAIVEQHALFANIVVDASKEENTIELDTVINKPTTTVFEKTPNRNDPCSCGSGKKYKKCCA